MSTMSNYPIILIFIHDFNILTDSTNHPPGG